MTRRLGALAAAVRGTLGTFLALAGLVCLVAAAWDLARPAGLAAAGAALLVLEFLLDDPSEEETR